MLKTSLRTKEKLIINGEIAPTHTSGRLIGEVKIIEKDKYGRTVFSTTEYNDITIGGSTYILEQLIKSESNDNQRFLMDILSSKTYNSNFIKDESIIGFVVGYNGENSTGISTVTYTNKFLSGSYSNIDDIVYFKNEDIFNEYETLKMNNKMLVDANGNTLSDKDKYIAVPYNNVDQYYCIKKPENVTIHHIWSDGSGSFTTDDVSGDNDKNYNIPISSYIELKLYIDSADCRNYFINKTNYGLAKCGINQIGLVTGVDRTNSDIDNGLYNLRLLTSLNFKTRELHNYENTLTFLYRIYCL